MTSAATNSRDAAIDEIIVIRKESHGEMQAVKREMIKMVSGKWMVETSNEVTWYCCSFRRKQMNMPNDPAYRPPGLN
jgi:hypothetical protein